MNQRNTEPLMIILVTGIFLLFVAGGVLHVFPGKQTETKPAKALPAIVVAKPPQPVPKADSLRALLADGDSISDLYAGLEEFYNALQQVQADRTFLHIAYFGDSMIEGDLVTQPLRRFMQQRFGGIGIGFVPVTTPLPGFRTTVRQSFNSNWQVCSFLRPGNSEGVYPGISGYVYISGEEASARFELPPAYGRFHTAKIIYGGKNNISLRVTTDTAATLLSLVPAETIASYTVRRDTAFSAFEINVKSSQPGVLYGVNFEYGPGVYVDNYAFRGNSGLPLASIPKEIFSGLNNVIGNKLLILHYGLNVFTPGVEDYHWYGLAMQKVIRHVRESSPGTSILMISMPDRSVLISGEYHTPDGLPAFIKLQQQVANAEHVAFFNLYEAMGGANSMKRWVEESPKLAGDDYTHPNGAGAARIASLVYGFLMKGYEQHLQPADSTTPIKPAGSPL